MRRHSIQTTKKRQVINITDRIAESIAMDTSVAHMFVAHTTAALTVMDLDPGTDLDLLDALDKLLPQQQWRHPHDPKHAPDHLLASIIGPSLTVPVNDGELVLGSWQEIVLIEFDGPRERNVIVSLT